MRTFQFVSVKLTLCLVLGILLGYFLDTKPLSIAVFLALALLLLGWSKAKQQRNGFPLFGIVAALTTILLGILAVSLSNPKNWPQHYSSHDIQTEAVWTVKIIEIQKSTPFSNRYVGKVLAVDTATASGKLLLNFPLDSLHTGLKVDDELIFHGKPTAVKSPLNPHQFDYQDYLKKQGVYHQVWLQPKTIVVLKNPRRTPWGSVSNFRETLITKLKHHDFGTAELGVIQALLLGQRNDISEDTYNDYKNAGAVHILAVSGLHVGILLLILQFLLQPLDAFSKGKQIKSFVVILCLWLFALVAGLSPSIVRAVTMFSFLAYGMNLNRPTNTFNIIALSMFFMLLVRPMLLFEVGFQMSYAAVIAIVWVYPKLQRFWYPKNWLMRKVWQLLSVSIAAQLGVLPLSLFYFHQFPALFFVSNLLIVPFLGLILGTGLLVLTLAYFGILPQFLVTAYDFLISQMNMTIGWVAQQENFLFRDIPFDSVQLVLGYLLVFGLVFTLSKPKFKNLALLLVSIIGFTGYGVYNQWQLNNKEQLVLAHQTRNSILLHQKGDKLNVLTHNVEPTQRIVTDYKIAERIRHVRTDSLRNSYLFGDKSIFIMDSLGICPSQKQVDYLILTQSPKINLERLLDSIQPKTILADGSNYKSYVERWKKTALKRKLPFHYTNEKGAYAFDVISKE